MKHRSLSANDNIAESPNYSPVWRSFSADMDVQADADVPTYRGASCSRSLSTPARSLTAGVADIGAYIGPSAKDTSTKPLIPSSFGITTVRLTIALRCKRGRLPTTTDVEEAIALMNRIMDAARACRAAQPTTRFAPAAVAAGATTPVVS